MTRFPNIDPKLVEDIEAVSTERIESCIGSFQTLTRSYTQESMRIQEENHKQLMDEFASFREEFGTTLLDLNKTVVSYGPAIKTVEDFLRVNESSKVIIRMIVFGGKAIIGVLAFIGIVWGAIKGIILLASR